MNKTAFVIYCTACLQLAQQLAKADLITIFTVGLILVFMFAKNEEK